MRVIVGVGTEHTERAKEVAETARRFAGADAEPRLVHVHRLRQMVVMDYTYVEPPERVAKELQEETEQLEAIASELAGATSVDVVIGNPVQAILTATEGADLLVIGRSHLGVLSRILEGSVESHLVHEAPCPVLIVP